jgi:putative intracellular protease/amidase
MTLDDLMTALHVARAAGRGDWPVLVAGHGALALVTHGAAEAGARAVVLYVAEPAERPAVATGVERPLPFTDAEVIA